ncbi:MAG: GUN4 domain-containing protein [Dolichospermum sp. DET50]|nr:GUN4 domain-containing protein [Dolichospermum sp. DET66]MBS3033013.1 GUN4 domain-containing protein [Dolichospermum sp. DET67]MBS3038218.1 GUN4 domain-containing protein [Dolichospermum sp. DET50]QSX70116.1 MAG: GUN4 domain-containing protein [Dolichospermum sp. DET69]
MKFSQGLGVILGTTTLALVQYQPVSALTSVQVNDIAKPITVMIGGLDGKGSGVIIAKNGNTYTVLTANHVVKKAGYGIYELITHDGQKYSMESAQTLGKLDLALVKFTSSKNYPLAKIADSRTVKEGSTVYYAGFPAETANQPRNYRFIRADITGRSQNQEGYELSYNGSALPGMSGGPVLNEEGLLIAIHGKAETQSIIIQGVQRTEIVGVQGIPTEKFPNLISNIQNNNQANTPRNNISPTNEPTPVIFQKLESLLKAGKWRDADLETWELMKKLTKREQEGWLRLEDVKNFPRQELRKMDQLWVKYSNGKFGFSVQKQIWLDLGGKLDGETDFDTFRKLGDRVGWRKNNDWLWSYDSYTFSTNALPGHLPLPGALRVGGYGFGIGGVVLEVEVRWEVTLFSSLDYNP